MIESSEVAYVVDEFHTEVVKWIKLGEIERNDSKAGRIQHALDRDHVNELDKFRALRTCNREAIDLINEATSDEINPTLELKFAIDEAMDEISKSLLFVDYDNERHHAFTDAVKQSMNGDILIQMEDLFRSQCRTFKDLRHVLKKQN